MGKYLTAFFVGAIIGAMIKNSILYALAGGTISVIGTYLFDKKT